MKGCKGSPLAFPICFLAFGLQVFVIATNGNPLPKEKGNSSCTYSVTIETSCTRGAETSNHVSLRFGDVKSNDIVVRHLNTKHVRPLEPQVLDDIPSKPFQVCMVDQFQVSGSCVESPICYIYLKLAGKDDWRPGFAQVRVLEDSHADLSSGYFYFRRYLPRRVWYGSDFCDTEVTPFGVKFKRKVFGKRKKSLSQ